MAESASERQVSVPTVVIVGGGLAGMTAARQCLQAGLATHIVEASETLGGLPAWLGFMFPTGACLLCRSSTDHGYGCPRPVLGPEFLDFSRHPLLQVHTGAQVVALAGDWPSYCVRLCRQPRYVDSELCTDCGQCFSACPGEAPLGFRGAEGLTKAIHKSATPRGVPDTYVIERECCLPGCRACADVCPAGAINLEAQPEEITLDAGAIIVASGGALFDARGAGEFGYGRFPGVLTGLEFERLASRNGPTEGRIVGLGGTAPEHIAWLQCIGSRDEEHNYCSSFCCMYATKQAILAKQANPDVDCKVFIMDDRVFANGFMAHYQRAREDYNVQYERCRISSLKRDARSGRLYFRYVNNDGRLLSEQFDMVVLSVGIEQQPEVLRAIGLETAATVFPDSQSSFQPTATSKRGVYICGNALGPKDMADTVAEACAAAALAIASLPTVPRASAMAPPVRAAQRAGVAVLVSDLPAMAPLNAQELADSVAHVTGVVSSRALTLPCHADSYQVALDWLRQSGAAALVAAAGSTRIHSALFERLAIDAGIDPHNVEYVPLASDVSAVNAGDVGAAHIKAVALLAAAVMRATSGTRIQPDIPSINDTTLVIGGGAAGLSAAAHIADSGRPVVLVERSDRLGGNLLAIPESLAGENLDRPLQALIHRVQVHPNVRVYTGARVRRTSGTVGHFRSVIESANGLEPLQHGAMIVATGATEYDGPAYSLGDSPKIMTLLALERKLQAMGQVPNSWQEVVFISCVGPWDNDPRQYWRCSRTCCDGMIRHALRIKRANPQARINMLIRETMTTGSRERFYTEARRQGILFTRFEPDTKPTVTVDKPTGAVTISWYDSALREARTVNADLLALAAATMPQSDAAFVAEKLNLPTVDEDGFFQGREAKVAPFVTPKRGVYVIGLAQGPKHVELSVAQALGAAQDILNLFARPERRQGHRTAVVTASKCVACLTCVRICPYQVPQIDHGQVGIGGITGAAWINPLACEGCSACVAECPQDAISMSGHDSVAIARAEATYYEALQEASQ